MKKYLLLLMVPALMTACSNDGPQASEEFTESSEVMGCDPLVDELAALMDEFKTGLEGMLEDEKIDEAKMEEWGKRGEELTKKIEAKGEEELGKKCWEEFNAISQKAEAEIMPLAMKVAMMAMGEAGMDMGEMMEKAEEAQQAAKEALESAE